MYERSGLHFLEIKEVCVDDAGSYTCSISNHAGTVTATAELHIQGEPTNQSAAFYTLPEEEDVFMRFSCCFSSTGSPGAPSR